MTDQSDEVMTALLASSSDPASLSVTVVPRPEPGPGEVLVAVRTAAVTPGELTWPEAWPVVPAHDVCGTVVGVGAGTRNISVGANTRNISVGDDVFGLIGFDRPGAAAEFVCVPATDLAATPASVDDVGAAALPLGALTAWQALFDHGHLERGQHVLVHGAAGGVGSYAVSLASWHGATVTATASVRDHDLVAALGADTVIDYTTRFENQVTDVDLVLDTVGADTMRRSWSVVRRGGLVVGIAEEPSTADAAEHGARGVYFVVEPDGAQLTEIVRLTDDGVLRPSVGTVLSLAEGSTAFRARTGAEHRSGRTVIRVASRP